MTTTTATPATTGLPSKAMLVNVNITAWSGRKHDKKVTREVEEAHSTSTGEAGRFNKQLTSKEFLAGVSKAAGAARQTLYDYTLPWGDNGDRLLASALYFEFIEKMNAHTAEYYNEVDKAENNFGDELIKRRVELNGLFNPADYPNVNEFRSKFSFKICIMPIPDAADLRLDINQTEVNLIKQNIEIEMKTRLSDSMSNIWDRVREQLTAMKDRLTTVNKDKDGNDKPAIFRDSLFNNLADLIKLLPGLNITDNPELNQVCEDMKTLLVENPDSIRQSATLRSRKAEEVEEIMKKFDGFFS